MLRKMGSESKAMWNNSQKSVVSPSHQPTAARDFQGKRTRLIRFRPYQFHDV